MIPLIEVEFKGHRKGIYSNPQEFPLRKHDFVIVQADRGEDLGRVNLLGTDWQERLSAGREEGEFEPILRRANADEIAVDRENRRLELEARGFFREEVKRQNLVMKLVDAEYQFDRRKLTFYFTADGRVDFRSLVKELAHHFKTRIDLRQIGARDEAKRLGGIGLCGRELCCSAFIREFNPVTTSMLKEQNLLLNPQKNTGLCGKLRCCLRYEVDQYREVNRLFPKPNFRVKGPRGDGVVEKISMCSRSCGIRWGDGKRFSYTYDQLRTNSDWDPDRRGELEVILFREDPSLEQEEGGILVASESPNGQENGPARGRGGKAPRGGRGRRKPAAGKKPGGKPGGEGSGKEKPARSGGRKRSHGGPKGRPPRKKGAGGREDRNRSARGPADAGGDRKGGPDKARAGKPPAENTAVEHAKKKTPPPRGGRRRRR